MSAQRSPFLADPKLRELLRHPVGRDIAHDGRDLGRIVDPAGKELGAMIGWWCGLLFHNGSPLITSETEVNAWPHSGIMHLWFLIGKSRELVTRVL